MENIVLLTVGMLYLTKISNNVQLYIIIYLGGKAMKRLVVTLLFVVIALSLSGCENSKSKETTNSKTDIVSVTNSKDDNKTKNEVMGKILLEDEYAKITYAGIDRNYTDGPRINFVIENKCNQNLLIQVEDVLVDDYSTTPIFSCQVLSGKKVKNTMTLYQYVGSDSKVEKDFKLVEGKFRIMANDAKNSLLKAEPFEVNYCSSGEREKKEEKIIFDNEYAKISYIGIERNSYGGPDINIKIENKSDKTLTIQATDILVDGYMVDPKFTSDILSGDKIKAEINFINKGVSRNLKSIEGNFRITTKDNSAELLKEEPFTIAY